MGSTVWMDDQNGFECSSAPGRLCKSHNNGTLGIVGSPRLGFGARKLIVSSCIGLRVNGGTFIRLGADLYAEARPNLALSRLFSC